MRMLLIVVVLIYGMELDHASWWYLLAFIAAAIDIAVLNIKSAPITDCINNVGNVGRNIHTQLIEMQAMISNIEFK